MGTSSTGLAYEFAPAARTDLPNEGWSEASINWEDDDQAVAFTRSQKNARGLLHQHGVGRLAVVDIEKCKSLTTVAERLAFERRQDPEQPDNPYHGNLLIEPSTPLQFQGQTGRCYKT